MRIVTCTYESHAGAILAILNDAIVSSTALFDYAPRYGEAIRDIAQWLQQGRIKSREDIVAGFDSFPETLLMLFKGENLGKLILKVEERA